MQFRRVFILFSLWIVLGGNSFAQISMPESGFAEGWTKSDSGMVFLPGTLYDYIDGGAEIFLEFGFRRCLVQSYQKDGEEITLEVYEMASPLSALGIYLFRKGAEKPDSAIAARNSATPFQVLAIKGRFLVQANIFSGADVLRPVVRKLLNAVLAQIPAEEAPDLFSLLPDGNRIPGTEVLFCGPFSLQPIYTFGEGDILRLGGHVFGVAADYGNKTGRDSLVIRIPYATEEACQQVFQNLYANLDPYLKVRGNHQRKLEFEDYKGRLGSVRVVENILAIAVHEIRKRK